MKRLKTAYEIALERANSLDKELSAEEKALFQREKLKPLLADFYREKIGPDQLWEELKKEEDPELYLQAQLLLLESIGLQTAATELQRRKEAVLAVEALRGGERSPLIERLLEGLVEIQENYQQRLTEYRNFYEKALKNARMSLQPVQTSDGRVVMQMQKNLDGLTEERLEKGLQELEQQSNQAINELLAELRENLKT
ncbi:MAG: hypothetical protein GX336_01855 [Halanaerobiaceae bacterium]|nr:hypothetical protein [Halanaerobiaceae bacterium]